MRDPFVLEKKGKREEGIEDKEKDNEKEEKEKGRKRESEKKMKWLWKEMKREGKRQINGGQRKREVQ